MRGTSASLLLLVLACGPRQEPPVAVARTTAVSPTGNTAPAAPIEDKPALATWGKTAARFADEAEARALLGKADAFVTKMGDFDRQARLATPKPVDEAAFLKHAALQVRGWPAETWEHWQKSMREVGDALEGLKVPMPKTVLFISTTGSEEFGKPYTRGNAIVIPEKVARSLRKPFGLIAHELFHVVSRHSPELRDELYGILGFQRVGKVTHPLGYAEQRLTNPDAYENVHAIPINAGERSFLATPLIRSKSPIADAIGTKLFNALEIFLLEVNGDGTAVTDATGGARVHSMLATDYNEKAALNTEYAIHPEEVLADNFALLLKRRAGHQVEAPRADVLDKIQAVFTR